MKAIVLMYMRSGSHFISRLLSKTPKLVLSFVGKPMEQFIYSPLFKEEVLIHLPEGDEVYKKIRDDETSAANEIFLLYAHETRPDLHSPSNGVVWNWEMVEPLINRGWKFFHLVRNGRNQLESLRKTQAISKFFWDQNFFKIQCDIYSQRMTRALECSSLTPNYQILKFEDLVADPCSVVNRIGDSCGLTVLPNEVVESASLIVPNTAFKDVTSVNNRSNEWTQEEISIFSEIVGSVHQQLGYE